jgi:A/G-specific adenine glycosylase
MSAILPEDAPTSAVVNAAAMELGATVCTARSPRCDVCPLRDRCAWRAAGYPDTGDDRRKQARYEGSDRQARGAVLKMLRDAPAHAVPLAEVVPDWPDPLQRDRAIDSLIADGLAEASGGFLRLPR